jgi:hypothetical protein
MHFRNFGKQMANISQTFDCLSLELSDEIIKACCLLHNFLRARDGCNFNDTLTIQGFDEMLNEPVPGRRTANDIRDKLANYFCHQMEKCHGSMITFSDYRLKLIVTLIMFSLPKWSCTLTIICMS